MKNHLLMFDVDGTLVRALVAEAELFPKATQAALGVEFVSSDWSKYAIPTDRGIITQIIQENFNREATADDFVRCEQSFFEHLQQALQETSFVCPPVAGAIEMFDYVRQQENTRLAIATAGWGSTAMLKLSNAGIDIGDSILTSSTDYMTKSEAMRAAIEQALVRYEFTDFDSVIYVGDSPGDADASEALGVHFIGVKSAESPESDDRFSLHDFSGLEAFVDQITLLQESS